MIRVSVDNIRRVSLLRQIASIRGALLGDTLWLQGDGLNDERHRVLAPVADGPVFKLESGGRMTPFGNSVPTETLPKTDWVALSQLLRLVLPTAAIPVFRLPRAGLQLVRSETEREPGLLLTGWPTFRDWALLAPEIRLRPLKFAVKSADETGSLSELDRCTARRSACQVIVCGTPIPPLNGERFAVADGLAVPLGYHWSPAVDSGTVRSVILKTMSMAEEFSRRKDPALLVWSFESSSILGLQAGDLVPATRTNIRASDSALGHVSDSDRTINGDAKGASS